MFVNKEVEWESTGVRSKPKTERTNSLSIGLLGKRQNRLAQNSAVTKITPQQNARPAGPVACIRNDKRSCVTQTK